MRAAIAMLLVIGCAGTGGRNPGGYTVHVLTADSLTGSAVAINGHAIDTSTVEAIETSVHTILDSPSSLHTVEEVTGMAPDLAIDFTGPATAVPPTFYGANLQWRSKFFLGNPRWKALVAHAKLDLLRFPGGQERVRFDGAHSRSGTPATDTLSVTADQPYEFRISGEDVASYIALCQELGIAAEPELDLTVDDPAMWADLVHEIVGDLGYDLKYVSVGNEPDIKSVNGNWPYLGADGATDDERRTNALAHYAQRYLAYRRAVDAVRPGLIYALGEFGDWSPGGLGANLDAVLGMVGDSQPGGVAAHWYMLGHWDGQPETDPGYPAIGHLVVEGNGNNNIGYLAAIAAGVRERAAAHGQGRPRLFIGEFGASWSATPADAAMSDRLAAALFNAEAQETGKAAGVDSMQWFGLSDPASFAPWVPSLIEVDDATGTPRPRPQYYVYLLYKHLYGDQIIAVPGGRTADGSIYASRDAAGRSYVMLINRTAATELTRVVKATTAAGTRLLRLTLHPHSLAIVSF